MRDRTAIGYGAIYGSYIGLGVDMIILWKPWWLGLTAFALSFYWLVAFNMEKRASV